MITPSSQIKINLPLPLKEYLESKASKFGMPISGYVKHLILKDVAEMEYPTFEPSKRAEEAYQAALKAEKANKLVGVKDIKRLFDEI